MRKVKGLNFLVWGMGVSGKAAKALLEKNGANVFCHDDGKNCDAKIFENKFDFCVVSPGVVLSKNDFAKQLQEKKVKIISEIELASWFSKGEIIAITGSNGKTTTTTLLSEILSPNSVLCGNVGIPFSSVCESVKKGEFVCLEVSSFQLFSIWKFAPKIAMILNLSSNHVDWHGSFEKYCEAKLNICKNQKRKNLLIVNSKMKREIASKSKKLVFGEKRKNCAYVENGFVMFNDEKIVEVAKCCLQGEKNIENIMAAVCVAKNLKIASSRIKNVVENFLPLPHRLQTVCKKRGVTFVNDSKSTTIASFENAISTIDGNLILLMGGESKGETFSCLPAIITSKVKNIFVFGKAAAAISQSLKNTEWEKICKQAESLENAFILATSVAKKNETILLSPACSSHDQFENFERRGEFFCSLAKKW